MSAPDMTEAEEDAFLESCSKAERAQQLEAERKLDEAVLLVAQNTTSTTVYFNANDALKDALDRLVLQGKVKVTQEEQRGKTTRRNYEAV